MDNFGWGKTIGLFVNLWQLNKRLVRFKMIDKIYFPWKNLLLIWEAITYKEPHPEEFDSFVEEELVPTTYWQREILKPKQTLCENDFDEGHSYTKDWPKSIELEAMWPDVFFQ